MKKFFISYSSEDSSLARFIYQYFNDLFQGKAEFFLADSIKPSKEWLRVLLAEIRASDAGMFLLTQMSTYRQWLIFEAGALWALGKSMFPVTAGDVELKEIHRPLLDFQVAKLNDEASVSNLIREISAICDMPVPPRYDSSKFCEQIESYVSPIVAFCDLDAVLGRIGTKEKPEPEILTQAVSSSEPDSLAVDILGGSTLCVTGSLKDSGVITLSFRSREPLDYMVLEVGNAEKIQSCFEGRMAKIVINHEPISAHLKLQRHPFDEQYIPRQNGFFLFSLNGYPTDRDFTVKIVLWQTSVFHLLFRIYFVRLARLCPRPGVEMVTT
ncbi:MAG TPA: hypothetical protein VH280_10855 [Verrucomicrobiae bacterium]|nr:hypothetical protein [Verrucomicrobiae bacterium]